MIQVLHIAAECYPAAKTGGLGDVVGSLPKYMTASGMLSAAIIPKYALKWIHQQEWTTVHAGAVRVDWRTRPFSIQQESTNRLGFPLFVVDLPGLFDRPGIYNDPSGAAYGDEVERSVTFQQAVLQWLLSFSALERPRALHCHDHHTGLIPWMVKHCPEYRQLAPGPTVFTIHNGQYQGAFSWKNEHLLPFYDAWARGVLDWNGTINPMAAAIKSAWAVSTVSEDYLHELHESSMGLEPLLRQEWQKEWGIINGIDAEVWGPATDPMLKFRLEGNDIQGFKAKNKQVLCEWFGLPEDVPLISFIGRLVGEKGSDLLPDAFKKYMHTHHKAAFLVLGSGERWTENEFKHMAYQYSGRFNAVIDYNEALSHQIYAGSDYLIMPSRVEPCGLNQLYSMRYGTIPIVRGIGGLKDTVPDIGSRDGTGRGIVFEHLSLDDIHMALHRSVSMWLDHPDIVAWLRGKIMALDFSWEKVVETYVRLYHSVHADVRPIWPIAAAAAEAVPEAEAPVLVSAAAETPVLTATETAPPVFVSETTEAPAPAEAAPQAGAKPKPSAKKKAKEKVS